MRTCPKRPSHPACACSATKQWPVSAVYPDR
jgi:hypothetical protein